jgi:hypothetical protein
MFPGYSENKKVSLAMDLPNGWEELNCVKKKGTVLGSNYTHINKVKNLQLFALKKKFSRILCSVQLLLVSSLSSSVDIITFYLILFSLVVCYLCVLLMFLCNLCNWSYGSYASTFLTSKWSELFLLYFFLYFLNWLLCIVFDQVADFNTIFLLRLPH